MGIIRYGNIRITKEKRNQEMISKVREELKEKYKDDPYFTREKSQSNTKPLFINGNTKKMKSNAKYLAKMAREGRLDEVKIYKGL